MSMTGCLGQELGTGLYTLDGAVAATGKEIQTNSKVKTDVDKDKTTVRGKTETKANNGAVATAGSSNFVLVPANNVDLASHVGQQVQISAIMVNAGHGDADVKIKNETKVDPENAPDTKSNSKTKLELPRSSAGQYTVMSVAPTGRPCRYLAGRSSRCGAVVGHLAADPRLHRLDVLDLIGRYGQVIAIEDDEIRELARRDRSEVVLAHQEERVAARVRDEPFFTRDRLMVDDLAAHHLAGHREPQRIERVVLVHLVGVGVEAPQDAAVLNHPQRRHVVGAIAVRAVERAAHHRRNRAHRR